MGEQGYEKAKEVSPVGAVLYMMYVKVLSDGCSVMMRLRETLNVCLSQDWQGAEITSHTETANREDEQW